MTPPAHSFLITLECPECKSHFDADQVQTFCTTCRSPLLARYDLAAVSASLRPAAVQARPRGIWRWAEILPVRQEEHRLTLGEGDTPLLHLQRLGARRSLANLFIKDEANLPTGSFKIRGLVMAVSRAVELGIRSFVIPTAGNAGSALAACCARAALEAHVFMPKDTPYPIQQEVRAYGADLRLVDGLINDAARLAAAEAAQHGWFDVSTFKEPYRVEGKKTMGLELAEELDWKLPDVIIYPTGGGTGLVGMWKAFDELQSLGWIGEKRPRMVAVQSEGCAPVVRAFQQGQERAAPWQNAHTIAPGLRVPVAFADRLILRTLRESGGTAVSVRDEDILEAQAELARAEGIFASPEGAAPLAGLDVLLQQGWLKPEETIILFNTGNGLLNI